MENKKKRRLVAIMFTDIVGYSRIMQEDEKRGIALRNRHREIFDQLTNKYDGKILQYFGDGTLSIFDSTVDAVECAIDMQIKFGLSPRVPLRIGIHTGDITFDNDDAYGHGMNIAARIEPICIPGGIYISSKVNEDILNHPWIESQTLGYYELKNINEAIEIFAITNEGVNSPEFEFVSPPLNNLPVSEDEGPIETSGTGFKSKKVAAILALLFGVFGVHHFYLGKKQGIGIAQFVVVMLGIVGGVWFFIAIPAIIGFINAVILMAMSRAEFNHKYNSANLPTPKPSRRERKELLRQKRLEELEQIPRKPERPFPELSLEEQGKLAIKEGDFDLAIDCFDELLEKEPENKNFHYALAVSYSMIQDAKNGFYHLSKAVEYGYNNFSKIKNHFTLAYLRSRSDFKTFENNGYRLIKMLPSPQEDLLGQDRPLLLGKLEKLEELGDLLHRGEISEEQFTLKKQALLREND